jgi:predicted PurR-regulated permease PerM
MSGLSDNLKKYFVTKITELFLVIAFLVMIFYSFYFFGSNGTYLIVAAVISFIIYVLLDRFITKVLDKWWVEELSTSDRKTQRIIGSVYSVGLFSLIAVFLYYYLSLGLNIILVLGAILVIVEIIKWVKHFKEQKKEDFKEFEEKVITPEEEVITPEDKVDNNPDGGQNGN